MTGNFIHRNNPVKQPKLIYTRSYPQYPQAKKRTQSEEIRENRNGCFVKYDKKKRKSDKKNSCPGKRIVRKLFKSENNRIELLQK
jgi:hypothetical protein